MRQLTGVGVQSEAVRRTKRTSTRTGNRSGVKVVTQGFQSGYPPPNDVLFPRSNSRVGSWTGHAPCMIAQHQHLTLWNCPLKPSIKPKFCFEFEPGENPKTATTNVNSALSKTAPFLGTQPFSLVLHIFKTEFKFKRGEK